MGPRVRGQREQARPARTRTKVPDTSFLIDYLDGHGSTKESYGTTGGDTGRWVMPVPALAEVLVGEGTLPDGDVRGARVDLAWGTSAVDEHTAAVAGKIVAGSGLKARSSAAWTH